MEEQCIKVITSTTAWEKDFPKGYGHTSIAFLKRCPGFEDAKSGSREAAFFVVEKCLKRERLEKLCESYPNSYLLPVPGKNVLPMVFAEVIGLPIWKKLYSVHTVPRKILPAILRFAHRPIFKGYVPKGRSYIIVDDVVTQGGTVSALREHVISQGGEVVAVTALAFAIGSRDIAPTKRQLVRLFVKFGLPTEVLKHFPAVNAYEELTNSQARYLLRFSSVRNVHKKLASHRRTLP